MAPPARTGLASGYRRLRSRGRGKLTRDWQMRRDLQIKTSDGTAKAALFHPDGAATGKALRGVILYMDAMGPRDALYSMAQRLADAGYVVLLPDLFYRSGEYGPFDGSSFANDTSRAQIMKMITETTQDMTKRDTAAFLTVLEGEGIFGPIGVVGYCMGGGRARPQRLPIPIVSWRRQASTAATSPAKGPIVHTGLPVR